MNSDKENITVPTGRKITKLVCKYCDFSIVFDRRKRDKKLPKMKNHIKKCRDDLCNTSRCDFRVSSS